MDTETTPAISPFERQIREQMFPFRGIGSDQYHDQSLSDIRILFGRGGNHVDIAARQTMSENFSKALALYTSYGEEGDVTKKLYAAVKEISPRAFAALSAEDPTDLALHLKEAQAFARLLVFNERGEPRFSWMTTQQAFYFSNVIAPLHDLFKYLGPPNAQVMQDHELLMGHVFSDFLTKASVEIGIDTITGKPILSPISPEDLRMIGGVIGSHENIFREADQKDLAEATDIADRSKRLIRQMSSLFFFVDVFTGVMEFDAKQGEMRINEQQLEKRFGDLYERHMNTTGKVFNPEWGFASVQKLFGTISEIAETMHIDGDRKVHLQEGWKKMIAKASLDAVINAMRSYARDPQELEMHHIDQHELDARMERMIKVRKEFEHMVATLD